MSEYNEKFHSEYNEIDEYFDNDLEEKLFEDSNYDFNMDDDMDGIEPFYNMPLPSDDDYS